MNVDCELERESCTDVVARDLRCTKTQILAGILIAARRLTESDIYLEVLRKTTFSPSFSRIVRT